MPHTQRFRLPIDGSAIDLNPLER